MSELIQWWTNCPYGFLLVWGIFIALVIGVYVYKTMDAKVNGAGREIENG